MEYVDSINSIQRYFPNNFHSNCKLNFRRHGVLSLISSCCSIVGRFMNDTDDVINPKSLEQQSSQIRVVDRVGRFGRSRPFNRRPRAYHSGVDVHTVCKGKRLGSRNVSWKEGYHTLRALNIQR